MITFAVLATGPSMSQELADAAKQYDGRIVVNDAFRLAPDADGLCAQDTRWWEKNPDAKAFAGRKFSCNQIRGVEQLRSTAKLDRSSNSGLLALHVAITKFGATRVLLFGVDLNAEHGAHYFGPHMNGLPNTSAERYKVMRRQFANYASGLTGVEVINMSKTSALQCFPFQP